MNSILNKINYEVEFLLKRNEFNKIYDLLSNKRFSLLKDIDLLKIYLLSSYIEKKYEFFLTLTNEILKKKILDREIVFILIFIFYSSHKYMDAINLLNNFINNNIERPKKNRIKIINKFMPIELLKINFKIKNEVNAFLLFGIYLRKAEFLDISLNIFEILLRKIKNNYVIFFHSAKIYQKRKNYIKALAYIDSSLNINHNLEDAINTKAVILIELCRYNEAYDLLTNVIITNKKNKYYYMNLGKILADRGNFKEAIVFFNKSLDLDKRDPKANYGKALCLLSLGEFNKSMKYLNFRMNGYLLSNEFLDKFNKPRLKNLDNLNNKKILIIFEQGFGDTLQFSRYLDKLSNMGAVIYFIPQKKLYDILKHLNKKIKIFSYDEKIPPYDFYLPLFDLPFLYYMKFKKFDNFHSYLNINKFNNSKFNKILNIKNFNIGICWKSNDDSDNKSFDLSNFSKISKIKNINLISLQLDDEDDIKKNKFNITPFAQFGVVNNFYNTAKIMKHLDLVISCDTSICHLSGSIGVSTWLLLKKVPDWRWLIKNETWYKDFLIFQQKYEFEWSDVFEEVYNKLIKIYN